VPTDLTTQTQSAEVEAFYARRPYPAPLTDLGRHIELYRDPDRRRAWQCLLWPGEKPAQPQKILVAGCGTSQGATIALREPDAQVTAIDISETSLAHLRNLRSRSASRMPKSRQSTSARRASPICATCASDTTCRTWPSGSWQSSAFRTSESASI
jgi:hypothetical protein